MTLVVDASAVLAVCKQEPGMEEARRQMRGGLISAVNLSEVYCRAVKVNKLHLVDPIVQTAELQIVPFDKDLALIAARLEATTRASRISFADRACLALGIGRRTPILTGYHEWAKLGIDVEFVMFRPKSNTRADK